MNQVTRTQTLNEARRYKDLQIRFVRLCEELVTKLPDGNDYQIEVLTGDTVSRQLRVLGHASLVEFGIHRVSGDLRGKLTFRRIVTPSTRETFLTVYYDSLGNVYAQADGNSALYTMTGVDMTNSLLPQLLEGLLNQLAAAK